jgi:hypothetical protein
VPKQAIFQNILQTNVLLKSTSSIMFSYFSVPKSTEQSKVTKTLPPAIGHFANSDDSPRRGAIYVWTKLVNPFAT